MGLNVYQIIDQTEDFLVINKSQGISVHKDQNETGLTMQLKDDLKLEALFLVHRLDKVTSGILVFAKHAQAASILSAQFRERQVTKYYLAISARKPRRKQGAIVGDMAKARRGSWKLLSSKENPAKTQFFSTSLMPGFRLFIIKPCTGKTHQIRVALKSEGAPILGDQLYGGVASDRVYLHAFGLGFSYDDQQYHYQCLPDEDELFGDDFKRVVNDFFGCPADLKWPNITNN